MFSQVLTGHLIKVSIFVISALRDTRSKRPESLPDTYRGGFFFFDNEISHKPLGKMGSFLLCVEIKKIKKIKEKTNLHLFIYFCPARSSLAGWLTQQSWQ